MVVAQASEIVVEEEAMPIDVVGVVVQHHDVRIEGESILLESAQLLPGVIPGNAQVHRAPGDIRAAFALVRHAGQMPDQRFVCVAPHPEAERIAQGHDPFLVFRFLGGESRAARPVVGDLEGPSIDLAMRARSHRVAPYVVGDLLEHTPLHQLDPAPIGPLDAALEGLAAIPAGPQADLDRDDQRTERENGGEEAPAEALGARAAFDGHRCLRQGQSQGLLTRRIVGIGGVHGGRIGRATRAGKVGGASCPSATAAQEVREESRPLRAQDRVGMKLHAFEGPRRVAESHDVTVGRACADFQAGGQRGLADRERVVACEGDRRGQAAKDTVPVVSDLDAASMNELGRRNELGSEGMADGLVAQTDAEHRDVSSAPSNHLDVRLEFVSPTRTGTEQDTLRRDPSDRVSRDLVAASDLHVGIELRQRLDDVESERVSVVDHEDHAEGRGLAIEIVGAPRRERNRGAPDFGLSLGAPRGPFDKLDSKACCPTGGAGFPFPPGKPVSIVLAMDIVIVGAGEVGYHLADILSREQHRVSVIDVEPEQAQRMMESLDVQALVGDGTRVETLTQAGASKADLVVAVTRSDEANMLASLLSRNLGAKRVIMRLKDITRLKGYRYFYKQTLGFDVVLSTDELAAEEIIGTVRQHRALEVESFADGRVQLRRLRIREEGELTADSLAALRLPKGLLVVAVARKEQFFLPTGEDKLAVDDQVYLIGRGPDLDQFELLAGAPKLGRRSVVIMGGGGVGLQVARKLVDVPGISVRVLERSAARAREIASEFSGNVMVLVGDSTDLDLLMEERIGEANVFIATTSDDEDNMVACQLARSLGVERTVAMVNKAAYRQIYDLLGVDRAISPRILCANNILRFVRSRSVSSIAVIADGRAEVLELEAHHRDGKKIKNLGLPRGTVLGAIVRGDEVIIPSGDTTIKNGDHTILFTLPENVSAIEEIFENPDAYEAGRA